MSGQEEEDRHNFALAKDGAKVVAANKEARKPESILDSDGDTFLKNECKADKWVLVELSQVAKVDLIKLSQVRTCTCLFKTLQSRYWMCTCRLLGVLDGEDTLRARCLSEGAWCAV